MSGEVKKETTRERTAAHGLVWGVVNTTNDAYASEANIIRQVDAGTSKSSGVF